MEKGEVPSEEENPQYMKPAAQEKGDMSDSNDGKGGKGQKGTKGGKEPLYIDPKKLPTDPTELLQIQIAEQMAMVNKVIYTLRNLPTGRPGDDSGGGSDPEVASTMPGKGRK